MANGKGTAAAGLAMRVVPNERVTPVTRANMWPFEFLAC